ncbi:hypothetical protein EL22_25295 [Halostagnicola sp. A56]|uniref:hypothetical protein n=1 Tax=Halostagnicola sp. A56 TaxID=1495067 RepID=UPI00049F1CAB|nr:hypothetical protein [Halostagnicola sp. A56]KDE56688.1 hypothetical protein EL22_25295 [Halostagnicola sp. A56]
MWSGAYLALFALACGSTYFYVIEEESIEFTSAIASSCWGLLAVSGDTIAVVSEGSDPTTIVSAGAAQYVMAGLAILSIAALIGAVIGFYPTDPEINDNEYTP